MIANVERKVIRVKTKGKLRFVLRVMMLSYVGDILLKISSVVAGDQGDLVFAV